MAKYKRHSQGGRFRAANIGDLGLRAFREQQDRQIRGLKEQNQQDQAYSRQHLQEMRGAASREIEHNRQIQNFYNKRDNLAIENTSFRGKTEYDRLMGEAREYEKKADFWKDFSETKSLEYVKAAAGIYDVATTVQSNHQQDIIFNDPKWQKFEASTSKLNNLASKAHLDRMVAAARDKKLTEDEKNDILGHIVDLGFRMNHKTQLAAVNRLLKRWPQEKYNLETLASERDIPWSGDTVGQFYYLRGREYLRSLGIDASSKAGKHLLDSINDKAGEERNTLSGIAKVNVDNIRTETLSNNTKDFIGEIQYAVHNGKVVASGVSAIEYNNEFNERIVFEGKKYRRTENGQIIKPLRGNLHHDMEAIMESDILSGRFKTKEQARRHTILQLKPGSKVKYEDDGRTMVYSEKDTWVGQHPDLSDKFEEAWEEYEKQEAADFKQEKASKDLLATQRIQQRAMLPEDHEDYLDLSDPKVVTELIKTNAANTKTVEFLGNFQVYNNYNLNKNIVTADLTEKWKSGNLKQLLEHITYLPPEIQDQWEKKIEQLQVLDRKGYLGTGLNSKAEGILKDILGAESKKPGAISGAHFDTVTEYIKQDILATFFDVSEKLGEDASDTELIEAMNVEIKRKIDGNEGIYRRSNTALSTVFYIDPTIPEAGTEVVATAQQVQDKLKGGLVAYDNLMNNVFNDGSIELSDGSRAKLISFNDADKAIRNINEGRPVPYNETIDYIYNNQPLNSEGERGYSKRDIWNEYFKGAGIDSQIPPDALDFSKYTVKASPVIKVNTNNMSDANKETVGAYTGMVEDGIFVPGEESAEQKAIEEKAVVKQNFIQKLLEHPFISTPHPLSE